MLLNLRRDARPSQVRALLQSVTRLLREHNQVEAGACPVHFVGVGTYSLDVDIFVYILTSDDNEFAEIRQDLLLNILDAVDAVGTSLALPTQASINYSYSRPGDQPSAPAVQRQVREAENRNSDR
ncbi:MAG TPA: hypothetical protein VMB25_11530 [Bryobacteraceae bacterium]|nr:hypothetical protein [Bryobacteraceae bacterium]